MHASNWRNTTVLDAWHFGTGMKREGWYIRFSTANTEYWASEKFGVFVYKRPDNAKFFLNVNPVDINGCTEFESLEAALAAMRLML